MAAWPGQPPSGSAGLSRGHLWGHLWLSSSSGARKHFQYRNSSVDAASTIRLTWRFAFGEPPGSLMAGQSAANALSEARSAESKGESTGFPCTDDDAIVVVMFCVYILRCADGSFYVGSTGNLPLRLEQHEDGRAATWTAVRRPVQLVWAERHPSRLDAVRRERQLKGWTRAKKQALVNGDVASLKRL